MEPCDPFPVLLPELWELIRVELLTDTNDASSCVALQRTCKAAYRLKPGLILTPIWHRMWAASAPHFQEMSLHMLRALTNANIFKEDWFPLVGTVALSPETDDCYAAVYVAWRLTPYICVYLSYSPGKDVRDVWYCNLQRIPKPPGYKTVYIFAPTLTAMLEKAPTLCFGASPALLEWHIAANDVHALFVKPGYRT